MMKKQRIILSVLFVFSCTPMNTENNNSSDVFVSDFSSVNNEVSIVDSLPSPDVNIDSRNDDMSSGGNDDIEVVVVEKENDMGVVDAEIDIRVEVDDVGAIDVCIPNCDFAECGDDGCGGNCGYCGGNEVCYFGICINKYVAECNSALCLFYDHNSGQVILAGYYYNYYQKAVFFTGVEGASYPNLEVVIIIDSNNFVAYLPVPEDSGYKLFNLKSWEGWLLVDENNPFLGDGLDYWCNTDGACAILILERKDF